MSVRTYLEFRGRGRIEKQVAKLTKTQAYIFSFFQVIFFSSSFLVIS